MIEVLLIILIFVVGIKLSEINNYLSKIDVNLDIHLENIKDELSSVREKLHEITMNSDQREDPYFDAEWD